MTASAFYVPRSLDEALDLLREHGPDLVVMGGGTIVMERVNGGRLFPRRAMSLRRAGMDSVRGVNGRVEIGAAATAAALAGLDALPPLAQAAAALGGPAVRTMATVGGNLFVAPPYGDLGVALLALDAQIELAGPDGRRILPLDKFFAHREQETWTPTELVTVLHVPRPHGRTAFVKLGRRQASAPAVVSVAVHLTTGNDGVCADARIVLGAAGPHPLRARAAEAALLGKPLNGESIAAASAAAMEECDPPTDALASAWYRRKMVGVCVRRALERSA